MQTRAIKIVSNLGALQKWAAIAGCLFACAAAQADISILDTGAGLNGAAAGTTDPNWTVSLLSTAPNPVGAGNVPPGGIPSGHAYLVPTSLGWPLAPTGPWVANNATSSWITYSNPTQTGGDNTGGTYQYQLQFNSASSGVVDVRWLSDNNGTLFVNQVEVGTKPDPDVTDPGNYTPFNAWNSWMPIYVQTGPNTIDLDVYNIPQDSGNPTGGRVEFSAVPEPTTLISGALLLLPFGASTLRILRRNRVA